MTSTALAQRVLEPATAVVDPAIIDKRTKNGRTKRVPKAVRHAIRLILSGECTTIKAAAERVKLTREHLSRSLGMPHVQVYASQESKKNIAAGAIRASARMIELIDADSEHVSANVSERLLLSEGILKTDQRSIAVNVDVRAGFVLDLREDQASLTPQQPSIEAKPLTDQEGRSLSESTGDE